MMPLLCRTPKPITRSPGRRLLWALPAACALLALTLARLSAAEVFHAQGEMAGEVTATSVLLQSRLTSISGPDLNDEGDLPGVAGVACFEWSESPKFAKALRTDWLQARPQSDFIVRMQLQALKPGTQYYYRLVYGESEQQAQVGPTRQFKTLPTPEASAPLSFIMGSCQNYAFFMHGKNGQGGSATAEDRRLGFPAYAAMRKLAPDFFIGAGDIVYYDHPASTAAKTLPELRRKWHEQFRFPRMIDFFAQTPAYWSKDDHDFRFNDADLSGAKLPAPDTGIEIFREQLPIHPVEDAKSPTYRTHRVHQHVQLWFLEGRDYRSPNTQRDGPDKSLWGAEQRAWLQRTLKESDATWKILISPTPMVGPDDASKRDNHANLGGFRHEADAFFAWVKANDIHRLLVFCGDRHWQYHSIHPSGVEEFSCGALNDENARRGVKPGAKNGTDPDALVKQPFLYTQPTGGFLRVTVGTVPVADRLRIALHDDEGTVLYEVQKRP